MSAESFGSIEDREKGLRRGLTSAQLTMIAIGGANRHRPVSWQQFCH
jgi:amino acid permease